MDEKKCVCLSVYGTHFNASICLDVNVLMADAAAPPLRMMMDCGSRSNPRLPKREYDDTADFCCMPQYLSTRLPSAIAHRVGTDNDPAKTPHGVSASSSNNSNPLQRRTIGTIFVQSQLYR